MELLQLMLTFLGGNFVSIGSALPDWIEAFLALSVAASMFTALTKTKSDDKYAGYFKKVMNLLSLNVGKNKNADDV